ncbi:MAG: RES family NAD+ phosphorylase [Pseudomonadota bacterium]
MTPLPPPLGGSQGSPVAWRLDRKKWASTWDTGEGAFQAGGRWNPPDTRVVYASLDPATAILEVAVHKGFGVLDRQPHILTRFSVTDPDRILVVMPNDIPDADWLDPNSQTTAQRDWGAEMLTRHRILVIPSAVSRQSWNLVFLAPLPAKGIADVEQTRFVLDPRLASSAVK